MASKILVVGTERSLTTDLDIALRDSGFNVVVANTGIDALGAVQNEKPDGVVLDPALAWLGGERVRQAIRPGTEVVGEPIIILNLKTRESKRILPASAASDSHEPAPFDINQLVAGIKELLKHSDSVEAAGIIREGLIEMDLECWTVSVNGVKVTLTAKEFGLLRMLLKAHGRVLTRDILREIVWEDPQEQNYDSRTVDVHVGRLRRKLGEMASYVETVRGVGYRFSSSS